MKMETMEASEGSSDEKFDTKMESSDDEAMDCDRSNDSSSSNNANNTADISLISQTNSLNTSIISNDSISDAIKVGPNSAKKIKLSKEQRDELKIKREEERRQRTLEREKMKAEKERERKEREQKQKEERERKERETQERKEMAEKLKLERQQKKEAETQKREEEKKKKEMEKEEERKKKELEKKEKEEKIKAKEKEKQLAEEREKNKLRKSQAFMNKFLRKAPDISTDGNSATSSPDKNNTTPNKGSPCKEETTQIELYRDFDASQFESEILDQNLAIEKLYLRQLLTNQIVPKCLKGEQLTEDVIEEVPEHILNLKFTFLQFAENIRPAYFGKRPFIPSSGLFQEPLTKESSIDYDIDSELEWDEGEPGESLSGDEEDEPEEKDDYEIDNEFFVPHGYLSDEEGVDGDEDGQEDGHDERGEKQRSMLKEQTLMAERNRRFSKNLIPQVIGCIWEGEKDTFEDKYNFLKKFSRVTLFRGKADVEHREVNDATNQPVND